MDEIRERLKTLDRLDMPNLWDRPASDQHWRDPGGPTPARRVAIAALALAIAAAGVGFAMVRLAEQRPNPSPAATPMEPVAVHAEITATIDTGKPFPEGVAVGEGGVWVATRGMDASGDVLHLDPKTGEIVARIPVPSLPGWEFGGAGITTGLGSVWVIGNEAEGLVLHQIDPATDELARTIDVGSGGTSDVWVDPSGIWVLAFGQDGLWLYRLDPSTLQVTYRVDIPADWANSVFAAGGWTWVLGNTDNADGAPPETLFKIDPATGVVRQRIQPADGSSTFVTPSADRIWFWHGGLRALEATTGQQVVGPIDLPDGCCASQLSDGVGGVWIVTIGPRGGTAEAGVWHVNRDGVIDRYSGDDLGVDADGIAGAFDPGTDTVWVVHYERTVTQLRITAAEPQATSSVSATNTGQ